MSLSMWENVQAKLFKDMVATKIMKIKKHYLFF